MGSPCELRLYAGHTGLAADVIHAAVGDIHRLEEKFSRYKDGNYLHKVNDAASRGSSIPVDDEFVSLLEYADMCFRQSDGLFDITSGILRRAWSFKCDEVPDEGYLSELLQHVGWQHISWQDNNLVFAREGMEIDFGGVVKEYAADRAAAICEQQGIKHGMVNLGGDISIIGPHPDGEPWTVQIQHPRAPGRNMAAFKMSRGGLASSGDYERFVEINGKRYSHILSPVSGWPVSSMAAVTVLAERCIIAGSACTISMLRDKQGAEWLQELGTPHVWMDAEQNMGGTSPHDDSQVIWHQF